MMARNSDQSLEALNYTFPQRIRNLRTHCGQHLIDSAQRSPIPLNDPTPIPRRGVIAVIQRSDGDASRFLVIRRSQTVSAPGTYCFPGGGVDPGETDEVALPRELREEVNIRSPRLIKRIWHSHSQRGVALAWWIVEIDENESLVPDPAEVAEVHWWTIDEMRESGNLLDSNEEFLQHWENGVFD